METLSWSGRRGRRHARRASQGNTRNGGWFGGAQSAPELPIAAAVVRGPSTPVADCPVTSAGLAWPGRGCRTVPWHGTARLRDLRCVAAVARQARMLRSPKLQCESGRTARGSSRPRLRAPASGGHPSQSSTGRDNWAVTEVYGHGVVAMGGVNVVKPSGYSVGKGIWE